MRVGASDGAATGRRRGGPVQWFGGKGNLLGRLLPLIPPGGEPYVEPFCGGASVLFARDPARSEVLNDLDGDLVNLFRTLQDPETFAQLAHRLRYTLYARAEFARALQILRDPTADAIDRAWAFFVVQNQGMSGRNDTVGTWSRSFGRPTGADGFVNRVDTLDWIHQRLRHVQIDQRDALEVIRYWDTPTTVFYVDPPYHHETRSDSSLCVYAHEMDDAAHRQLVDALLACQGAVVLSGYEHPTYGPLDAAGWVRTRIPTACHAAGRTRTSGLHGAGAAMRHAPRVECVWQNPRTRALLNHQQLKMPF